MEVEREQRAAEQTQTPQTLVEILNCLSNPQVRTARRQDFRFSAEVLVIDATKPYYRMSDQTYATSLLVIDRTLNRLTTPLHPSCSLTLISNNDRDGAIFEIGSVVQLTK